MSAKIRISLLGGARLFFVADEHYFHTRIIQYCDRPFRNEAEMREALIETHNAFVGKNDVTVHVGDFSLGSTDRTVEVIRALNGRHVFVRGSHDSWMKKWKEVPAEKLHLDRPESLLTLRVTRGDEEWWVVCCHYAMRVWPRSHHGSWHVFGHSHGNLEGAGKSCDVGVDATKLWRPVSFEELVFMTAP